MVKVFFVWILLIHTQLGLNRSAIGLKGILWVIETLFTYSGFALVTKNSQFLAKCNVASFTEIKKQTVKKKRKIKK